MAMGVTTLAQFNGVDGLGAEDATDNTAKYVGYGALALALGALAWASMRGAKMTPNKRRKQHRRHKRHGLLSFMRSNGSDPKMTRANRLFRFPEGVMTEKEWVRQYADRLSEAKIDWHNLIDRRKHFRLGGDELAKYEAQLKKKAEKPEYRAWKGDVFHDISKETYLWAKKEGLLHVHGMSRNPDGAPVAAMHPNKRRKHARRHHRRHSLLPMFR